MLSTLGTLLATGDRVERIEGVLSGTLSYLFNSFTPGQRFSALVAGARAAGFTEPDPRDDLSGAPRRARNARGPRARHIVTWLWGGFAADNAT